MNKIIFGGGRSTGKGTGINILHGDGISNGEGGTHLGKKGNGKVPMLDSFSSAVSGKGIIDN